MKSNNFLSFFALIVVLFALTETASSYNIGHRKSYHVYHCRDDYRDVNVRIIRSGAFARVESYHPSPTWTFFETRENPYVFIMGLKSGNNWYFLQKVGDDFRLSSGSPQTPGYVAGNDPRLFRRYLSLRDRQTKYQHLQTGTYMAIRKNNRRLLSTASEEAAADICLF